MNLYSSDGNSSRKNACFSCDKATISAAFAEKLAENGIKIVEDEKWRDAVLANGTVEPLISGYCIADIVLRTKAGEVLLDQTHIDVLQGPESGNLLYIGKAEERRLGLSSFKEQVKNLADDIKKVKDSNHVRAKKLKARRDSMSRRSKSRGNCAPSDSRWDSSRLLNANYSWV